MKLLRTAMLILVGVALCAASGYAQTQAQTVAFAPQTGAQSPDGDPSNAAPSALNNDGWHLQLSPYLWFAGTHGTVGVLGRDVSVHESAWDLLQHVNFGIMGAAEARHDRFLLTGDMLWIRLSDSSALPFPGLGATSADVRVGQLVWTSKIGYRVIDSKKFKADANVGVRYWHLGQKLSLNPSILGLSLNPSQSWADIVVGGRVELPLGRKTSLTALGDVGGWNATAKLDYQFSGLLNFKVRPKWVLSAGYRYLFVDYRSGSNVYNMVTPGLILGITYRLK